MYITCQQCSTIFRLDEKLLKPTGSKVRCSQCKNIFIAHPPTPDNEVPLPAEPAVAAAEPPKSEAVFDQELEGIDLSELDSILEQDSESGQGDEDPPETAAEVADEPADFNVADLDIDFEKALMDDEDIAPEAAVEAAEAQNDDLDLDMDFELGNDEAPTGDTALEQAPASSLNASAGDLNHDIEMVLDDFEDSLGQPESAADAAGEISDADFDLDFDLGADPVEDEPQDMAFADDDADLLDADALMDEDVLADETQTEDIELSLDDGEAISFDDAASRKETPDPLDAPADADDDLGLGDLDSLLDDEDEAGDAEVENVELSLDDTAVSAKAPADGGDDLDLGDLDSLLDDEDEAGDAEVENAELSLDDAAVAAETPAADSDDLDLGDLGSLLDDDDDTGDADPENLELSLDDGEDASFNENALAGDGPAIAADDLDLGDLESMLDEPDEVEDAVAQDVVAEDIELSLNDPDELSLDDAEAGAEAPAAISDDLDLGDLDSLLDDDDDVAEADVENVELSLDDGDVTATAASQTDDDLDFDGLDDLLDEDDQTDEAAAPEADLSLADDSDGLDLSDLSGMLDDDKPMDTGDDIDLSMDLEPSPADGDTGREDAIEDLEFELDAEFEDKPLSQTDQPIEPQGGAASADEELDLSDIEQMLEDDTLAEKASAASTKDTEKWLEDQDDNLGFDGEGEIDLSEIEEAIDAADTEIDATGLLDDDDGLELDLDLDAPEHEVEELDLELEMESNAEPMTLEEEESDELDLSDLDLTSEDTKSSTTTETIDGGDIELEFQIEENGPLLQEEAGPELASATTTSAASAQTTESMNESDFSLEETIATEPLHETGKPMPAKMPKKKGTSKSLVMILLLALLGGGGYFGYDYVIKNDIQIPFLSEYLNPKPKDPTGTLNLSTLEINSKFLENEKSGRLFIVTGKVRNGNTVPCKMVRLKGKLFTKGKVLSKTEHTFAGVIIPDQDLATLGLVEIKKQLTAPLGAAAGAQVMAGQTTPFMVVFSELPDDLDEFAIELVSATKIE